MIDFKLLLFSFPLFCAEIFVILSEKEAQLAADTTSVAVNDAMPTLAWSHPVADQREWSRQAVSSSVEE